VRSFLDEGEGIVRLLREEYQGIFDHTGRDDGDVDENRTFIEQLLGASGTDLNRAAPSATKTLLQPLSDREQEILVFLAHGVSNREIATRLFVSENTVKFHLKNIYAKLAVGSRLQAINAARQLGLVT
jgi:LuxR family maltose regulon positive regulatory protein